MDDFLTVDEAARELQSHPNTIRNHIKRGLLPNTFKKGHVVLVSKLDIEALKQTVRKEGA